MILKFAASDDLRILQAEVNTKIKNKIIPGCELTLESEI